MVVRLCKTDGEIFYNALHEVCCLHVEWIECVVPENKSLSFLNYIYLFESLYRIL